MEESLRRLELKLRTESVRRLVAPLIHSVVQIHAGFQPDGQNLPPARKCLQVVEAKVVDLLDATSRLIQTHQAVITPASVQELQSASSRFEESTRSFIKVADVFVQNTSDLDVRNQLSAVAEELLLAIADLLCAADNVEIRKISEKVNTIKRVLGNAQKAPNREVFVQTTSRLMLDIQELTEMTRRRLADTRNPDDRDNLQAALGLLHRSVPLMHGATIAALQNPDSAEAQLNKKFAFENMHAGLDGIQAVLENRPPNSRVHLSAYSNLEPLIEALETFRSSVCMEPRAYRKHEHRQKLEELLERIAVMSASIADESRTRPKRRHDIVQGVNNLRQALQDLLTEYERNTQAEASEDLDMATVHLDHSLKDLRRHLRRAIVDQVSDTFSTLDTPLQFLVDAALKGEREETAAYADVFGKHADDMCTVAELVCKMSPDPEGVGMLRYAALLLRDCTPQVASAALLAALRAGRAADDPAVHNLHQFRGLWRERADALKAAMDALISMDDMLAVTEQHVIDDFEHGFRAIHQVDSELLDRVVGTIRGRCVRVSDMVDAALEDLPNGAYSENLARASNQLRKLIPVFEDKASGLVRRVDAMDADDESEKNACCDEMVTSCDMVHGAICNIRHALLMNRNPEDVDSDNEYEEDGGTTAVGDQRSQVSDGDAENQQRIMRHLPEESRREIQKHLSVYKMVQQNLVYEVSKWDEESNDLIALAKAMLKTMNNMTDFTNGRGPFKTTMDVINAAQDISKMGNQLKVIADNIGKECVESDTKKDLYVYIERIIFFCHQLNVTSRVKAEIKMVENEAKVSGLDSVFSLIQNAKNLTSAVLTIVKLAFIASTKYRRNQTGRAVVEWRLAPPQQSAFALPDPAPGRNGAAQIVRRRSDRRPVAPIREMANFRVQ